MRRTVPLLPAVVFGLALVVLAVGVTDWWNDRPPSPNAADIGFYDDMTTHHFQAIAMARTYMRYGSNDDLRSRAEEIDLAQSGDIRVMQEALVSWDEIGTPDTAMEWMGEGVDPNQMPGLATPAEMAALSAARGVELDDLFTRLMIEHHGGGAAMGDAAAELAGLSEVRETARLMAKGQRREIDELNKVRQAFGFDLVEPDSGH
ncbi:MAG: DUF305 domain-containing protein [Actinomycetota bacterium]|nr:DUF305 domain-containing protein [Actinomycetota bacterium]